MIVTVLNEYPTEPRAAITPNLIKHYLKMGLSIYCEQGLGEICGFTMQAYQDAGATLFQKRAEILPKTAVLLALNEPSVEAMGQLPKDALIVCSMDNEPNSPTVDLAIKHSLSLFSMNLIPRISRAQSMDSLSSQANLAGYRAVIEGVAHFNRVVPMMMTAAGMIQPAKVLILGAGVAGLQAIATAKRLGAVVYAFDVRPVAKEQVESLGAEFIEVKEEGAENFETAGGYAREMTEEYKAKQAALIHKYAAEVDLIVSTALIPGKKAPILISKDTVLAMKKGAVVVDMATSKGGNCELSEKDKIRDYEGVTLIGYSNLAGLVPATASELYSQNLLNLMRLLLPQPESLVFNPTDEIIKTALLCHQGHYLPFHKTLEPAS